MVIDKVNWSPKHICYFTSGSCYFNLRSKSGKKFLLLLIAYTFLKFPSFVLSARLFRGYYPNPTKNLRILIFSVKAKALMDQDALFIRFHQLLLHILTTPLKYPYHFIILPVVLVVSQVWSTYAPLGNSHLPSLGQLFIHQPPNSSSSVLLPQLLTTDAGPAASKEQAVRVHTQHPVCLGDNQKTNGTTVL